MTNPTHQRSQPSSTGSSTTSRTASPRSPSTAREDILAFATFPEGLWQQIWSNNPNERLNREIRRRNDSVGIFPNREAIVRLVRAVLAEQTDEWAEGRRYLGLDILAKSRLHLAATSAPNIDKETLPALSA